MDDGAAGGSGGRPAHGSGSLLTARELLTAEHRVYALLAELMCLESHSWMRRQMVAMIRSMARLMYTGNIGMRLMSMYEEFFCAEEMADWVRMLRTDILWPNSVFRTPPPPVPHAQLWLNRRAMRVTFQNMVPHALASVLGRDNVTASACKLFDMVQIPILARSLAYTLFDLLLLRLFPDLTVHGLQHAPPSGLRTSAPTPARPRKPRSGAEDADAFDVAGDGGDGSGRAKAQLLSRMSERLRISSLRAGWRSISSSNNSNSNSSSFATGAPASAEGFDAVVARPRA